MTEPRKLNLRLPPELHAALLDLAAHECTSANAVMVAALRNWIQWRNKRQPRAGLQATTSTAPRTPAVSRQATVPKVGPNVPCPCGSGQKYKRCHGRA